MKQMIDSLHESKSDLEICRMLAQKLGIESYSDFTDEEWLRDFWQASDDMSDSRPLPDYDDFKQAGLHRWKLEKPAIAFEARAEDPQANPFETPSGKIEIYSQKLEERNTPDLPPIPTYIPAWEGREDPLADKYPLQLISTHSKRRIHSNMHNNPWLNELEPHKIWINSADAVRRNIRSNDRVRVFNDRGTVVLAANVTERIMPGVVSIGQGAWYTPDAGGVDRGGCVNVLLKDACSPAGAFCSNTCLVQVEREEQ